MPEIFHRDQQALQTLREITRLAVAGCALFLHACNAAGVPLQELKIKEDNNSRYDSSYDPRNNLIRAMRERSGSQESYEKTVADAVVELATKGRSSKPMLAGSTTTEFFDIESLRSRTIAVLRGKDPVLEVLNKRIRIAVRDILAQGLHHKKNDTAAPLKMRSGLAIWNVPRDDHESGTLTAEPKDIVEKLFFSQSNNTVGIQLADLYCYPIFNIFEYNKKANEYWRFNELSLPKLFKNSCQVVKIMRNIKLSQFQKDTLMNDIASRT